MSTLSFDNLLRHVGHEITCSSHGLPPQNVVLFCETCDEVIADLDADGESLFGLVPVAPPDPMLPPAAMRAAIAAD
jgi:hypothetical protein